jgi:hypothetical protein
MEKRKIVILPITTTAELAAQFNVALEEYGLTIQTTIEDDKTEYQITTLK